MASERVLLCCIAAVLICVIALLVVKFTEPGVTQVAERGEGTPPSGSSRPQATNDAQIVTTRQSAKGGVILVVTDKATGAPLDNVVCAMAPPGRVIERRALVALGETTNGTFALPAAMIPDNGDGIRLALTKDGYLSAAVTLPAGTETCRIAMSRGSSTWVRLVGFDGAPVPNGRVVAFPDNVDASLLETDAFGDGDCLAGDEGAWFASAPCDAEGYGVLTVPDGAMLVGVSNGWFPARLPKWLPEARDRDHAIPVRMGQVQCAVVAIRGARVLGRSLAECDSPAWHTATNAFAFAVRDRVMDTLRERFPGDLVVAQCLVPRDVTAARSKPTVRFRALVDGVGMIDVVAHLRDLDKVALESLQVSPDSVAQPLGSINVAGVEGYDPTWPSPLSVVPAAEEPRPVTFDLHYGDQARVPVGTYRVFERRLGSTGRTEVGAIVVDAGQTRHISRQQFAVRWPVTVSIRDGSGASPKWCKLRIRRTDGNEEWTVSPRDPRSFQMFLEEGTFQFAVSVAAQQWQDSVEVVAPRWNRFEVVVKW